MSNLIIDGRTGYYTDGNGNYYKFIGWYSKDKNDYTKKVISVYEKITKALVKYERYNN